MNIVQLAAFNFGVILLANDNRHNAAGACLSKRKSPEMILQTSQKKQSCSQWLTHIDTGPPATARAHIMDLELDFRNLSA